MVDHLQPIPLPAFGEGVAEAQIVEWLVAEGDAVKRGDQLLEVQTAKAVLTVEAPSDGVLAEQVANVGSEIAVGGTLGFLRVAGEGPADDSAAPASEASESSTATPDAAPPVLDAPASAVADTGDLSDNDGQGRDQLGRGVAGHIGGSGFLSPRLRTRIESMGLTAADLAGVSGSGRGGRLTASDLERFISELDAAPGEEADALRLATADNMRRSWARPLATVARQVRLDALLAHRREIDGRPSATVYLARALGLALSESKRMVRRLVGRRLIDPERIAVAVAVDADTGVRMQTLVDPENGSLADLTALYSETLAAARAGRGDMQAPPAIATVSNYGSLGLDWATAIPSAEQGLVIGLGAPRWVPDWDPKAGNWGRARAAYLTVTFDHRVADGAAASVLVNRLVALMERPEKLA